MKNLIVSLVAVLQTAFLSTLMAQGPMHSGIIQSLSKEQGTLTLRTEKSGGGPITYYGMGKAEVLTVGGKPGTIADLAVGQRVSVFYGKQGEKWMVSRVLIAEPGTATAPAAAGAATSTTSGTAVVPGTTTPVIPQTGDAATDGDRTTRPGQGASGDRTTRPPNSAATDGDRTTVPADGKRGGTRNNSQ